MDKKDKRTYSPLTLALGVLVVLLLLIICYLLVRLSPPAPPLPPVPPSIQAPPPPDELKKMSGVVVGYSHNVHLDINGLQLKTAKQGTLTFAFRPHTARAVTSVAAIKDTVEVYYSSLPNDEEIFYRLHKIKHARKRVDVDHLPPPPRIPPGRYVQTFTLDRPVIVTDGYGGVAALQGEGKIFHFKPEQVEGIQALIKNGHSFTLQAVQRGEEQGFINSHHDDVYIVISITIDNKTFMIR